LKKQFNTNLANTFIPIKIEFPRLEDKDFDEKFTQTLFQLITELKNMRYFGTDTAARLTRIIEREYKLSLSEDNFPWKKK
jgi:hypothetical protein